MNFDPAHTDGGGLLTGAANTVFSVETSPEIYIELWDTRALNSGLNLNDATRLRLDGNTQRPEGPTKMYNPGESIAIKTGDSDLALAAMQLPDVATSIALPIYNLLMEEYVIRLKLSDMGTTSVYLDDRSTGERTELVDGWNNITFTADVGNGSTDMADRFAISFGEKTDLESPSFAKAISLYPNPVIDGQLFLQLPKEMDKATVTITNMLGQVVKSTEVANNAATGNMITVSGLTPGLYHINVIAEDAEYSDKVIIK